METQDARAAIDGLARATRGAAGRQDRYSRKTSPLPHRVWTRGQREFPDVTNGRSMMAKVEDKMSRGIAERCRVDRHDKPQVGIQ
jgi:hypothetical protein